MEEESHFSEEERERIIRDVIQESPANQFAALTRFERYLNKPFDYQGSLTYYDRKAIAIAETME